ncbi:MAG: HAD-IA family hydrolase [bacterium]|nr:HAD-IA family hydrolase [bacterium]
MTTSIQLVLFDVGNVIVRATHAITFAILAELGVRPDKWALFFHGKHYSDFARGKITGAEFAQAVREVLEAPNLTDDFIRIAHDAHIYAVDPDAVAVLGALKAADVPLAFVTTTNEWQTARELEFIRLSEQFGPVVRSHEIGMTKTDPDAWSAILRTIGWQECDPSTILLVDDSAANCKAARSEGISVHQYDPTPVNGVTTFRYALSECGLLTA